MCKHVGGPWDPLTWHGVDWSVGLLFYFCLWSVYWWGGGWSCVLHGRVKEPLNNWSETEGVGWKWPTEPSRQWHRLIHLVLYSQLFWQTHICGVLWVTDWKCLQRHSCVPVNTQGVKFSPCTGDVYLSLAGFTGCRIWQITECQMIFFSDYYRVIINQKKCSLTVKCFL